MSSAGLFHYSVIPSIVNDIKDTITDAWPSLYNDILTVKVELFVSLYNNKIWYYVTIHTNTIDRKQNGKLYLKRLNPVLSLWVFRKGNYLTLAWHTIYCILRRSRTLMLLLCRFPSFQFILTTHSNYKVDIMCTALPTVAPQCSGPSLFAIVSTLLL